MLTSLDFLTVGSNFPPTEEEGRIATYDLNRALYNNDHSQLLDVVLSVVYPDTTELENLKQVYVNLYRSISTLWSDLLFSETPKIRHEKEQEGIDDLLRAINFWKTSRKVALDVSRYGNGVYKIRMKDNKVIVEAISPANWYPVVNPDNINEVLYHVIAYRFTETTTSFLGTTVSKTYVKAEIHGKGFIEHKLFELSERNEQLAKEIPLNQFSRYTGLPEREDTGIDDFMIVPVENQTDSETVYGYDDYNDINSLITGIELHLTKFGRDLEQQGDIKYGPATAIDQDGEVKKNSYIIVPGKDEVVPGVVTWDTNSQSIKDYIEQLMLFFYITSEASPALLFPDFKIGNLSGTALKRLMQRTILKAARLAENFDSSIKNVIEIAGKLDNKDYSGVEIGWQDGLVEDLKEKAEAVNLAIAGEVMSKKTGIAIVQDIEGEALENEYHAIQDENAYTVPETGFSRKAGQENVFDNK